MTVRSSISTPSPVSSPNNVAIQYSVRSFASEPWPTGRQNVSTTLRAIFCARLVLGELEAGDAAVKMRVRGLFLDYRVEYLGKNGVVREIFHFAISLPGRHLVNRPECHVSRCETAAQKVRQRRQEICVRVIGLRHVAVRLPLPVFGGLVSELVQKSVEDLPVRHLFDAPAFP